MPIPKNQFEGELGETSMFFISILAKDPTNAYSWIELNQKYYKDKGLISDLFTNIYLMNCLSDLVKRGILVQKVLDGAPYYLLSEETQRQLGVA